MLHGSFSRDDTTTKAVFTFVDFAALLFCSACNTLCLDRNFGPQVRDLVATFCFSVRAVSAINCNSVIPISRSTQLFAVSIVVSNVAIFTASVASVFNPLVHKKFGGLMGKGGRAVRHGSRFVIYKRSVLTVGAVLRLGRHKRGMAIVDGLPRSSVGRLRRHLNSGTSIVPNSDGSDSMLGGTKVSHYQTVLTLDSGSTSGTFIMLSTGSVDDSIGAILTIDSDGGLGGVGVMRPSVVLSPRLFNDRVLTQILGNRRVGGSVLISVLLGSNRNVFDSGSRRRAGTSDGRSIRG